MSLGDVACDTFWRTSLISFVAVVLLCLPPPPGSNQGIGFEIARALAKVTIGPDADRIGVIMAVRALDKGREAADKLREEDGVGDE